MIETRASGTVTGRMSRLVTGASLKPHTTKAELRDAADGTLLFTFELNTPPGPDISRGSEPYGAVPLVSLNHLRRRLRERQTVVEVTTTLPDQALVRAALTNVSADEDFDRRSCDDSP